MTENNEYIAGILQNAGLLQSDKKADVIARANAEQRNVMDVLSESGTPESDMLKAVAAEFGMEAISLSTDKLAPGVAEFVPEETATRYRAVPIQHADDVLTIAISDPLDLDTVDTLRYMLKHNLNIVAALPKEIDAAIAYLYQSKDANQSQLEEIGFNSDDLTVISDDEETIAEDDEPIIRLVNMLILEGFRTGASDIHLEPLNAQFRVRYRIDGVLREVDGPPRRLHPSVISRLKIMSKMDISEKRLPQDGRIEIKAKGRPLDLRVSAIPTNHGESIVMRILDKQTLALGLPNLGFFSDDQQIFENLITLPDGILLITGPTGSGKTTTLYACLNELNQPNRKIITVEDPVEYQLSGINQVQVRSKIGLTFSAALRSILRQAPNTVMIGEIRDKETAEIAVNAALTGHLVLSTLHTNDAPGAVTRLIDIGVKPFLVSSAVRGIMAQRLIRTICPDCKTGHNATDSELRLLGPAAQQLTSAQLFAGEGCDTCAQTGYKGRNGIFELLTINDEVRQMIYEGMTASELRSKARELGMRTLREDGIRKAIAGVTTLSEILRVTMRDEN